MFWKRTRKRLINPYIIVAELEMVIVGISIPDSKVVEETAKESRVRLKVGTMALVGIGIIKEEVCVIVENREVGVSL